MYFHKTNCLKEHSKSCTLSRTLPSLSSSNASSVYTTQTGSAISIVPPHQPSISTSSSATETMSASSSTVSQNTLQQNQLRFIPGLQTSISFIPPAPSSSPIPSSSNPTTSATILPSSQPVIAQSLLTSIPIPQQAAKAPTKKKQKPALNPTSNRIKCCSGTNCPS